MMARGRPTVRKALTVATPPGLRVSRWAALAATGTGGAQGLSVSVITRSAGMPLAEGRCSPCLKPDLAPSLICVVWGLGSPLNLIRPGTALALAALLAWLLKSPAGPDRTHQVAAPTRDTNGKKCGNSVPYHDRVVLEAARIFHGPGIWPKSVAKPNRSQVTRGTVVPPLRA